METIKTKTNQNKRRNNRRRPRGNINSNFPRSDASRDVIKRRCRATGYFVYNIAPGRNVINASPKVGTTPTNGTGYCAIIEIGSAFLRESDVGLYFQTYSTYRVKYMTLNVRWQYTSTSESFSYPPERTWVNNHAVRILDDDASLNSTDPITTTDTTLWTQVNPVVGLSQFKGTKSKYFSEPITVDWRPLDASDLNWVSTASDNPGRPWALLLCAIDLGRADGWLPNLIVSINATLEFATVGANAMVPMRIYQPHLSVLNEWDDCENEG